MEADSKKLIEERDALRSALPQLVLQSDKSRAVLQNIVEKCGSIRDDEKPFYARALTALESACSNLSKLNSMLYE